MTFTPAARKLVEQSQPYPPVPAPRAVHTPLYYKTRSVVRGAVVIIRITALVACGVGIVIGYGLALTVAALWH